MHVEPYTPAERLAEGKKDKAFRTKPQIALELVEQARTAGIAFRAVVADCAYGDNGELESALCSRGIPHVLARRGSVSQGWAKLDAAHSFEEAIADLAPRDWQRLVRRFRDGHRQVWWAAELRFLRYGPDRAVRAIVATTDRRRRPPASTWYLSTNLPVAEAPLAEVVRLYGLRNWIEQHYKRIKNELGWAEFMVRSDTAIRRHWALVCCAFAYCWWHELRQSAAAASESTAACSGKATRDVVSSAPAAAREKNRRAAAELATGAAARAGVAGTMEVAQRLLAGLDQRPCAARAAGTAGRRGRWPRTRPLSLGLTNYR